MSAKVLLLAMALVCIIEGIIPFVAPAKWLEAVRKIADTVNESQVRIIGLSLLMLAMVLLLFC